MLRKSFIFAVAAATLLASGASASAPSAIPEQSSFTLEIHGFVPVICRATVNATSVPTDDTHVTLGTLSEFCNNPSGYQVWADYSPELAGSTISVDGHDTPLSDSGSTLISGATSAAIANHELALELPQSGVQGSISIRVVAL